MINLGSELRLEDNSTLRLGTAVQLKLQNKGGGAQLVAYLRCHLRKDGERKRTPHTQNIKMDSLQAMSIRQAVHQKITETGYTISDFCLTGSIVFSDTDNEWYLSDEISIESTMFLRQKSSTTNLGGTAITMSITELVVLNRAILHTDGTTWYSESVELGAYSEGIAQLTTSLEIKGGKLESGRMFDIWCCSPRQLSDRAVQDVLQELGRIYPQKLVRLGTL